MTKWIMISAFIICSRVKTQRYNVGHACGIRLLDLLPSTKYLSKINAIGMTDMVAAEFIPWKTIGWEQQIYNHQQNISRN